MAVWQRIRPPASGKEFKSEASWDTAWEAAGYMDMLLLSLLVWFPYNNWYISDICIIYIYIHTYVCYMSDIYIYIYIIMFIIIIITIIYYGLSIIISSIMYVWYMLMVSTVTGCNWAIFSPLGQAPQRQAQTGPPSAEHPSHLPATWSVIGPVLKRLRKNGFVWKCWVNIPNEIAIFHRDNDH